MSDSYLAVVATESEGRVRGELRPITDADLPDGQVTVKVAYSSLNYKDGLAVTGKGKIARRLPMICGADLAGVVEASTDDRWQPGDEVVVTGWGLSETHPGGYTARQRVEGDWLVRPPAKWSLLQTMALGTAGFTAMLAVRALQDGGVTSDKGEVLVTGASGGVGSVAVALLARLGFEVTASTGNALGAGYLKSLGAGTIIDRAEMDRVPRPLETERWAGVIDPVGGHTLASAIAQTRRDGVVAVCGLVASSDLAVTVFPFILRGVRLQGIDSVYCPAPRRQPAWDQAAEILPTELLDSITTVEPMTAIAELAEAIVAGQTRGRVVIDVNA
jgi:acrylyl-CoA reductase (NADPH)